MLKASQQKWYQDCSCLVFLIDQILKTSHAFLLFLVELKCYQQNQEHFFILVNEEQKYFFLEFFDQLFIIRNQYLNRKIIYLNLRLQEDFFKNLMINYFGKRYFLFFSLKLILLFYQTKYDFLILRLKFFLCLSWNQEHLQEEHQAIKIFPHFSIVPVILFILEPYHTC